MGTGVKNVCANIINCQRLEKKTGFLANFAMKKIKIILNIERPNVIATKKADIN